MPHFLQQNTQVQTMKVVPKQALMSFECGICVAFLAPDVCVEIFVHNAAAGQFSSSRYTVCVTLLSLTFSFVSVSLHHVSMGRCWTH